MSVATPATGMSQERVAVAAALREAARRLKAAGVRYFRELHDGLYGLTIYVADPDGNMIELYQEDARLAA